MLYKKILTLEDLVNYCKVNNFGHFNSNDMGYQICVHIPAKFEKSDNEDDTLFYGNVLVFHTGINRNRSNVTEAAAKKAMKNLAYKPVLANFCEIDGVKDFTSHDFEIDEDGNFIYQEKQVGCFTSDIPYMKEDENEKDRMNVYAKVAIPRQYTDAVDIIERKGGTDVSVELAVNELAWDGDSNVLILSDITVMGLTLLGTDPETGDEVKPGMAGAHLQIEDFSIDNNSVVFNQSEFIEEISQAIIKKLDNHIYNYGKEEPKLGVNENVTEDNIVVNEENLDDDTNETKVLNENESSEDKKDETVETYDGDDDPSNEDDNNDSSSNDDAESEDESESEDEVDDTDDSVLNNGQQENKKAFSINGVNFEVSLSEIQWAIYELVNNTYSEADNDYYSVEVYEGSKTVVMSGLFSGRSYKQGYKVRNNIYSLVGDRIPVKAVFVTADEEAELDKMRSNYSVVTEKLEKYESESQKMSILNSSDYLSIADQADFEEFKKVENHFDMTIDEVKNKADSMLLDYAKSGKLNFAKTTEVKEEAKKDFFAFARRESNTSFLDGLLNKR